ncbi:MAG: hypothetical protein JWO81_831 [Alphaproteobacteria bacterium]|nr:hypothetical protein [Alphaproteobacteria bacterium]
MPHLTTLAIAAGLSVAAAVTGLHLGRATVAEINPAYLQDPEVPFYSDLVPGSRQRADWAQVQSQEYQAAAQAPAPASCVGCTWPVDPTPRPDPALARYDRAAAALPRERAEAPAEIVIVEQPASPDWTRVERYARYPVDHGGDAAAPAEEADEGDPGT